MHTQLASSIADFQHVYHRKYPKITGTLHCLCICSSLESRIPLKTCWQRQRRRHAMDLLASTAESTAIQYQRCRLHEDNGSSEKHHPRNSFHKCFNCCFLHEWGIQSDALIKSQYQRLFLIYGQHRVNIRSKWSTNFWKIFEIIDFVWLGRIGWAHWHSNMRGMRLA